MVARLKVGVQLYSVRAECERDLRGTLEAIAGMGYEGVEFAGFYDRQADELRDMLRALGLEPAGAHIPFNALVGEKFEDTVNYNRKLGNTNLIVPSLPKEFTGSREGWVRAAHHINSVAERLSPLGMRTGYHNHWVELTPLEGELPLYLFFDAAKPDVIMQIDTGHVLRAGLKPESLLELFRRYPGRARSIHIKDYSHVKGYRVILGEGDLPLRELVELCGSIGGTEWLIVEQEDHPYPPLETLRRSLVNLEKALG